MAKTPEGEVKKQVKALLEKVGAYYFMPVQGGYGAPGLDFHCVVNGRAFFIETKAPGKKMTPRQRATAQKMTAAGAAVFVVDGPDTLKEVSLWLAKTLLE